MNLAEFILELSEKALEQPINYITAGHNGPYHDLETPVRNSGHWLIAFSKCYEWTGKAKFKEKVAELAKYLCSEDSRPYGYSFHHRNNTGKDKCNGLIGQAWSFEALLEATRVLGDFKYARLAEEVFFQHPFNEGLGLWNPLEVDGRVLPIDTTFNHQLWFAACISLAEVERRTEILRRVKRFLDCLDANLTVLPNGLVYHPIEYLWEKDLFRRFTLQARPKKVVYNWLKVLKHLRLSKKQPHDEEEVQKRAHEKLVYKSVGYHAFNMYAFALLTQQMQDHPFWSSKTFRKMVVYMEGEEYRQALNNNNYGYPYNPPGFEVPFSLFILKGLAREELIEITRRWAGEQFRRCFNQQTGKMERDTEDPDTLTARIYELTRLPREILESVEIDLH